MATVEAPTLTQADIAYYRRQIEAYQTNLGAQLLGVRVHQEGLSGSLNPISLVRRWSLGRKERRLNQTGTHFDQALAHLREGRFNHVGSALYRGASIIDPGIEMMVNTWSFGQLSSDADERAVSSFKFSRIADKFNEYQTNS